MKLPISPLGRPAEVCLHDLADGEVRERARPPILPDPRREIDRVGRVLGRVGRAVERLARGVIEACKQCGRNTLMEIATGRTLAQLLDQMPSGSYGLIAHPCGSPLDRTAMAEATEVIAMVGPEGGFTDEELAAAEQAGLVRVSLGPHILRVETAAISLAALFLITALHDTHEGEM